MTDRDNRYEEFPITLLLIVIALAAGLAFLLSGGLR